MIWLQVFYKYCIADFADKILSALIAIFTRIWTLKLLSLFLNSHTDPGTDIADYKLDLD